MYSNTSFNIKNKDIELNDEDVVDIISLLTYCRNYHPSKFLRKAAKRILDKFYQQNIFKILLDK